MGTMLAFPLGMPLGGVVLSSVRANPKGQNLWLVEWVANADPSPASYMIFIDGKFWGSVVGQTSIWIRGETGASPIFQVAQLPIEYGDPGFSRPGYFTTPQPNKIQITWDPPASVADVESYRIYWDSGTGTVSFTTPLASVEEDGSSSYEHWTDQLTAGTYKFVIRPTDTAGNEDPSVAELTRVLTTYPSLVTGEAIVVIAGPKVTITWNDPADIGAGSVRIFSNLGNAANLFPDYDTVVATIAAGTETWTSGNLADGIWVFGLRVFNGSLEELNTYVILTVRIESGAEVSGYPPKPQIFAENSAGGKVVLTALVYQGNENEGVPIKAQFFTNDGAGGAIDYGSPISPGFVNLTTHGPGLTAALEAGAYGETARKFAARIYTTGGITSVNSDEVTITPDSTVPPSVLNAATAAGRD